MELTGQDFCKSELHGCPCGFKGDPYHECRCTPGQLQKYMGKISGPLLDRIDIHVEVAAVPYEKLAGEPTGESSHEIRQRVNRARQIQHERLAGSGIYCSARFRDIVSILIIILVKWSQSAINRHWKRCFSFHGFHSDQSCYC